MLTFTDAADVRQVEQNAHGLEGQAWGRRPDGVGGFRQVLVVNGSITLNQPGSMPGRTCRVTVLYRDAAGAIITDYLNPLGSWIRLAHKVTRVDGTTFTAPLGTFRVDAIDVDDLAGSVDVSGSDAGVLVGEYGLNLNAGEVLPGAGIAASLQALLSATVDGIVTWWTAGAVDVSRASGVVNPTRLQYTGSRVEPVTALSNMAGVFTAMPVDNSYVFQSRPQPRYVDPGVVTVRPGGAGNMVTHRVTTDRQGLANVALISYTVPGTETSRRLQVEYVDSTADIRAGGPFGRVTMDVQSGSATITSDNDAAAIARAALKNTLNNAMDVEVATTPIYGLEPGDRINVENHDLSVLKGQLVGGSIGLTAADQWTLRIRTFTAIPLSDGTTSIAGVNAPTGTRVDERAAPPSTQLYPRNALSWWDYPDVGLDTSGNTPAGWGVLANNGLLSDGGTHIRAVANGGGHLCVQQISSPYVCRYVRNRVMATVWADSIPLDVRIRIQAGGTVYWGSPVTVQTGLAGLVSHELALPDGQAFTVGIDCVNAGAMAIAPGAVARLSNVVVQWTNEVAL